ncbi:MAG: amidohydrolase [Acidobacteriota bacterium]|nr:amidohydrolase [Acidobacteriota bacterium]
MSDPVDIQRIADQKIARQSPWGPLLVADAHIHFFSHRFFELLAAQKPGLTLEGMQARLEWKLPPAEPENLAEVWARELDRQGVDRAALIASLPGDHGSVTAAVRAHPDRFFAWAMVNPRSFDGETIASVRVACLFPAMHGYSMHDSIVEPVLEWAAQGKRAVFVHCGALSVGVRQKLGLPSPFDLRFSNPIDLHALAARYPQVPFIVPHFGAGFLREALMLADLCPNVYLDTSSSNRWMRYQESHMDLRQVFRHALEVAGPKRLLFGSDSSYFPRGWHHQIFEEQSRALYELGVSVADARAIFSENLLRIMAV